MQLVPWVTLGVASFAMIGLLAYVIVRRRRSRQPQSVTSPESLTTDLDNEKASGSESDAELCSPVQDMMNVSQSTPDLIGHDGAGYLATRRAPDVIDGAFHLLSALPLSNTTTSQYRISIITTGSGHESPNVLLPRCMECRHGVAMRILSVCPSVKRVHCDKTEERSVQIFVPYERLFSLVF